MVNCTLGYTCGLNEQVLTSQPFYLSLAENFLLLGGDYLVLNSSTLWILTLVEDRLRDRSIKKEKVYLQRAREGLACQVKT